MNVRGYSDCESDKRLAWCLLGSATAHLVLFLVLFQIFTEPEKKRAINLGTILIITSQERAAGITIGTSF